MKCLLLALGALASACQNGSGSARQASVSAGYRNDISALCDVMKQSGADQQPPDARQAIVAMWLGPHITTDEGRKFLISIQPLQGEAKAKALESEGERVGLSGCPLAAEWRGNGGGAVH